MFLLFSSGYTLERLTDLPLTANATVLVWKTVAFFQWPLHSYTDNQFNFNVESPPKYPLLVLVQ